MRNVVLRGALAIGIALLPACWGQGVAPGSRAAPENSPDRGYGGERQQEAAGATVSLESEEESGGSYATMVEMLRGRVPGLEITESASGDITARIRGTQSILFPGDPLLVVDGVAVSRFSFSSTLRSMDPRDVQSVQVLKDVGSTAFYGTRGAHGVILIRLKRY